MGKDTDTAEWGRAYKALKKEKKARVKKEIHADLEVLEDAGVNVFRLDRRTGHWRVVHDGKGCDLWETTGTVKFGKNTYARHGAHAVRVISEHLGIGVDWSRP